MTIPSRQGRAGLLGMLATVRREPQLEGGGATSLGEALARTGRLASSRSLIFVVSDFRGPRDWRRELIELAGRHDVVAVEIRDPREQDLPDVGELWLVDPETGRQLRVDTSRRRLRERFAAAAANERAELAALLQSSAPTTWCCGRPATGCAASPGSCATASPARAAPAARPRSSGGRRRPTPAAPPTSAPPRPRPRGARHHRRPPPPWSPFPGGAPGRGPPGREPARPGRPPR